MSSKLKLKVEFLNGTSQDIEIGELKPTGLLVSEVRTQTGKNVAALQKNGKNIPPRVFIKTVFKNGDVIKEVAVKNNNSSPENPRAKYLNDDIFQKIQSGKIPREAVLNIRIRIIYRGELDFWVLRGATLDELRGTIFKIIGRHLGHLILRAKDELLGVDKMTGEYNGNKPLETFGIVDGSELEEVNENFSQRLLEKIEEEKYRRNMREAERRRAEAQRKADERNLTIQLVDGSTVQVNVTFHTTIDELKQIIKEKIGTSLGELITETNRLLGWDNFNRSYDGKRTIGMYNIRSEETLTELSESKFLDYQAKGKKIYEDFLKQEEEIRKAKEREAAKKKEREEFNYAKWAKWAEDWARKSQREREEQQRGYAPPPVELTKEERCRKLLNAEGIRNKVTFLRWALSNHPDKVSGNSPEEKARITEKFQVVNDCVDLLGIKNIRDGGRRTRKSKKRSRRGRSRKN